MVGELITLPLRVGMRATRMWLRVTGEAAGLAVSVASQLLDRGRRDEVRRPTSPAWSSGHAASSAPAATRPAPPAPASPVTAPPPVAEAPTAPTQDEPVHVSEEPELVEELAEAGAEEGAGAEVHVEEPWEGYEQSNAKDVIARLATADVAELAAVQLYERGHRGRQTILAAVERELRIGNGSGSPRSERNR
jgi:hypothetical protein